MSRKKYSWVYIMQDQAFHALKKVDDLETLLTCMSPSARRMADTRIGLTEKLACLHSREMQMTL